MKNFGETLKKLRKQKDMTQEQLAEYVNISPQSVSKWETNLTLPDITIIPILANIFDVSADVLLGIDITLKDERIEKINKDAFNFLFKSQYKDAEKILRDALKEYPNSYKLMSTLLITLRNIAWNKQKTDTVRKTLNEEIISIGEKVLAECTDDTARHSTIQMLCYTYCDMDENEKAMDLVNKLPGNSISSNYLRGFALKGTEKLRHIQREIVYGMGTVLDEIIQLNHNPIDGEIKAYNPDETAALQSKVIDIINILCEDGNFGYFNDRISRAHINLFDFYFERKNLDAALKHLKLAAHYTVLYDAKSYCDDVPEEEYTSLLFRGLKIGQLNYISPKSNSKMLLDRIENQNYFLYFPTAELNAIKEELQKYANPATL